MDTLLGCGGVWWDPKKASWIERVSNLVPRLSFCVSPPLRQGGVLMSGGVAFIMGRQVETVSIIFAKLIVTENRNRNRKIILNCICGGDHTFIEGSGSLGTYLGPIMPLAFSHLS